MIDTFIHADTRRLTLNTHIPGYRSTWVPLEEKEEEEEAGGGCSHLGAERGA